MSSIESRIELLERHNPPGQNIHITTWPPRTVEQAIKEYEENNNIKFDHNDPTNTITEVVFIGSDYNAEGNPIS
jgi:hypothetical protein